MKFEDVKALPDAELDQFIAAGTEEQKARAARRKQETITRIKEMAASVGVTVAIEGARGRRPKARPTADSAGAARRTRPAPA